MLKNQHFVMNSPSWREKLRRRKRQVMDIHLAAGEAPRETFRNEWPMKPPIPPCGRSCARWPEKALVTHAYDGPRYLYKPAVARQRVKKSMLKQMLDTFFEGSREQLVAALLDSGDDKATPEELDRLAQLIEKARQEGK